MADILLPMIVITVTILAVAPLFVKLIDYFIGVAFGEDKKIFEYISLKDIYLFWKR